MISVGNWREIEPYSGIRWCSATDMRTSVAPCGWLMALSEIRLSGFATAIFVTQGKPRVHHLLPQTALSPTDDLEKGSYGPPSATSACSDCPRLPPWSSRSFATSSTYCHGQHHVDSLSRLCRIPYQSKIKLEKRGLAVQGRQAVARPLLRTIPTNPFLHRDSCTLNAFDCKPQYITASS